MVFGCFEVLSATILRETRGKIDSGRIMLLNPALNCWGDMRSITVCHLTITRFDLQKWKFKGYWYVARDQYIFSHGAVPWGLASPKPMIKHHPSQPCAYVSYVSWNRRRSAKRKENLLRVIRGDKMTMKRVFWLRGWFDVSHGGVCVDGFFLIYFLDSGPAGWLGWFLPGDL